MLEISRESALERWDNLPQSLREAILSDDNENLINQLSEIYSLSPKAKQGLILDITNVLYGFIKQTDIPQILADDLGLPIEIVNKIASEIIAKIFNPLKTDLESIYSPLSNNTSATTPLINTPTQNIQTNTSYPTNIAPTTPQKSVQRIVISEAPKPAPKEETTLIKPSVNEAPFILHEHTDLRSEQVETPQIINNSPLRPMFYKAPVFAPTTEEKAPQSKPITAKLELGIETPVAQNTAPKMAQTAHEEIRQVNYSQFKTSLNDPFAGNFKQTADTAESTPNITATIENNQATKPAVPDTNIVNLKDIPL